MSVLLTLADDLRNQAIRLRDLADTLRRSSECAGWSREAADAMRRRATYGVTDLLASAERHDAAAELVRRHAAAVDAELAAARQAVHDVADGVTSLVHHLVP